MHYLHSTNPLDMKSSQLHLIRQESGLFNHMLVLLKFKYYTYIHIAHVCSHTFEIHIFISIGRQPYLLVASSSSIYKLYPNGSDLHLLVDDGLGGGILSVACHYRYILY